MPLGLFNLLTHYVYETSDLMRREDLTFSVYNKHSEKYEPVYVHNISSKLLKKDPVTKYTGMTLQMYYALFLLGMVAHFIVVLIVDVMKNKKFNKYVVNNTISLEGALSTHSPRSSNLRPSDTFKKCQNWNFFSSISHAFTSYVIPEVSIDWDESEECDGMQNAADVIKVSYINMNQISRTTK